MTFESSKHCIVRAAFVVGAFGAVATPPAFAQTDRKSVV